MGQGRRVSWRAVFVLGVWAVMTAADAWLVARYGRNCPLIDDWSCVLPLVGIEPAAPWLFKRSGEHFLLLPKACMLCSLRLSHFNYQVMQWFGLALLSCVAVWLLAVIRRVRGNLRLSDSIFPFLCLHIGHWENFTGNLFCVQFILSTALILFCLPAFVLPATRPRLMLASACGLLLPLCGAQGWVFAPAAAALLAWQAHKRGELSWGIVASAIMILLCLTCPAHGVSGQYRENLTAIALHAWRFAGAAACPASVPLWAAGLALTVLVGGAALSRDRIGVAAGLTGIVGLLPAVAIHSYLYPGHEFSLRVGAVPFVALSIWLLGWSAGRRLPGPIIFVAGMSVIILAVVYGRNLAGWSALEGMPGDHFSRYRTLLSPFLAGAYLFCEAHGGSASRRLLPPALALGAFLMGACYISEPLQRLPQRAALIDQFLCDARVMTPERLSRSWTSRIYVSGPGAGYAELFARAVRAAQGRAQRLSRQPAWQWLIR